MKPLAMSHWNIFERFVPKSQKALSKVKPVPVSGFSDKGYIEKLRNSAPIHVHTDSYTPQQKVSVDMPLPAAVEFFNMFVR